MGKGQWLTLALAMLAFRRFKRVLTPMSECNTSCTFCCICGSGASCFGGSWAGAGAGGAGAWLSMGDTGAPSVKLLPFAAPEPDTLLKSGLKLSVLSMGGNVGGAAIVAAQ